MNHQTKSNVATHSHTSPFGAKNLDVLCEDIGSTASKCTVFCPKGDRPHMPFPWDAIRLVLGAPLFVPVKGLKIYRCGKVP